MPNCFKCGADADVGQVAIWFQERWRWVRDASDEWQESTKSWVRQSQSIWDQPDRKIEPQEIYCKFCWKDWGQHVKPGCRFALTRSCEEEAIRVGIQFREHPSHNGNPFYCPLCKWYFNHGAGSLPTHLWESHRDQRKLLPARKRKLEDMSLEDFPVHVLHVSGCSNRTVSKIITGTYVAQRWHHDKPVYQKDEMEEVDGYETPVVIYFWDSRHGEKFHGWWFSARVGSREVWAYNSSNLGPDDLTVPLAGWRVPSAESEVDESLSITIPEAKPSHKVVKHKNSEFELRWEFVASGDGEKEDWQPMSKDMNDALETRWADGWFDDDGEDTFRVQSNGFTYRIDCYNMVQCNVKTHRTRRIRRGQARPDPLAEKEVQLAEKDAKLAEKESELAEKQAQLDKLLAENKAVLVEKAELMEKVRKTKKKKKKLEKLQADHAAGMVLQEAWRLNQLVVENCRDVSHSDAAFSSILRALIMACPVDHHSACERIKDLSIIGLQQVCNPPLWKNYEFRKEQVRREVEGRQGVPSVTSHLPSGACSWARLDAKINEVILLHGTTPDNTQEIARSGFDPRLARSKGLYGQGIYFTDQSCKSMKYSGADSENSGCFIIARVILGHPKEATGPLRQQRVEPFLDDKNPSSGKYHSVIAKPGTPTEKHPQVHREFVLFEGGQAYPEMIVHFKLS